MTTLIDFVVLLPFHTGINDGNNFASGLDQFRHGLRRFREMLFIEGENAVAAHVIDIQPQTIHRDAVLAEVAIQ